jgi:hypothetical protein
MNNSREISSGLEGTWGRSVFGNAGESEASNNKFGDSEDKNSRRVEEWDVEM